MPASSDESTTTRVLTSLSAVAFVAGLLVSTALLVTAGEVILAFVLAGVLPTLLGYAGLSKTGALPWRTGETGEDEDLVDELKRRYAQGELDDAEMERKVETLLAADEGGGRSGSSRREPEFGRTRR